MALDLSATYPGQVATGDAGYPYGRAQNVLVVGDGSGTPWEADIVNDLLGFEQALLDEADIVPSGSPDEVGSSDYLDAVSALIKRRSDKVAVSSHAAHQPGSTYSGASAVFGGAAYNGTMAVLVGLLGRIESSHELETWTTRTAASAFADGFFGVVAGVGGLFVAVGQTGTIQTSPDGITWTSRTAAASYAASFRAVTWAASGGFVAVGDDGEIQTSPDGVTWTHRTAAASYTGDFFDVCTSGSLFVAVGDTGEIQTSPDGVTWTHRAAAASYTNPFFGVAYGSGIFVAVGYTNEIQTSPDGVTWTHRAPAAAFVGSYSRVAYGNGVFLAVASSDGIIHISFTGTTWESLTTSVFRTQNYYGITFAGNRFLIGGAEGTPSSGCIRVTLPVLA